MKVIKATDSVINALRKMDSITRDHTGSPGKRISSGGMFESSSAAYAGPFSVKLKSNSGNSMTVSISTGSLCAPDMQILQHIPARTLNYTSGQAKKLLVLKTEWNSSRNNIKYEFLYVSDPWENIYHTDPLIAVDEVNPKTEEYPHRNPLIAVYPIARITDDDKAIQLQYGNIVDYNRWWRS